MVVAKPTGYQKGLTVRNGDSKLTVTNVVAVGVFLITIGGVIIKTSMAADSAVSVHNESDISHPKEVTNNNEKIDNHDSDEYAHEPMRQMWKKDMDAQTRILIEEIRKIRE